jgi:hypothetical protein
LKELKKSAERFALIQFLIILNTKKPFKIIEKLMRKKKIILQMLLNIDTNQLIAGI